MEELVNWLVTALDAGQDVRAGEVLGELCVSADAGVLTKARSAAALSRADTHRIGLVTSALAAAARTRTDRAALEEAESEVESIGARLLIALDRDPGLRPGTLADLLETDRSQVSRALSRLLSSGAIEIAPRRAGDDGRTRRYQVRRPWGDRVRPAPFENVAVLVSEWSFDAGLLRSDMLPVGPGDGLEATPAAKYLATLGSALLDGSHRVTPALQLAVPKRGFGTRPAALAALPDRILYAALTRALVPAIESALPDKNVVVWPRAIHSPPAWDEFERAALDAQPNFILTADVAGFYESIDHGLLVERLSKVGAPSEPTRALASLLQSLMGSARGLPQGLAPSDPLASAYLSQVDEMLVRDKIDFVRHGDDYRFPADSIGHARYIGQRLHQHLRAVGLLPNSEKTRPVPAQAYEEQLEATRTDGIQESLTVLAGLATTRGVLGEPEGHDPEADAVFTNPYGEVDFLASSPMPFLYLDRLRAGRVLSAATNAVEDMLVTERAFHEHARSMRELATALSPAGMARIELDSELLARVVLVRPEATRIISRYVRLVSDTHPEIGFELHRRCLSEPDFQDSQEAWLLQGLLSSSSDAVVEHRGLLLRRATEAGWLARLRAGELLQRASELPSSTAAELWRHAPAVLRSDVLLLVQREAAESWASNIWQFEASPLERNLVEAMAA